MSLCNLKNIKNICLKHKILPQKSLGQNFLISEEILNKIIQAADLKNSDLVLEVGPGLGVLTKKLAEKVKQVVAVEKDEKLVEILKKEMADYKNIELVKGDILNLNFQFSISNFQFRNYKIVANLPYSITSAFLWEFLQKENQPNKMVLMLQKEVAEKICAQPGEMSLLSVMVQYYSQPKIEFKVNKNYFYPKPKVDSVVISFSEIKKPILNEKWEKEFFKIIHRGFAHPRKMLKNNLLGLYEKNKIEKSLLKAGLNLKIRAEELSVEQWKGLTESIFNFSPCKR